VWQEWGVATSLVLAFSMIRSRRERTTSAATPTTSLSQERGLRLRQIRRARIAQVASKGLLDHDLAAAIEPVLRP
jgi:hypothetical protein